MEYFYERMYNNTVDEISFGSKKLKIARKHLINESFITRIYTEIPVVSICYSSFFLLLLYLNGFYNTQKDALDK